MLCPNCGEFLKDHVGVNMCAYCEYVWDNREPYDDDEDVDYGDTVYFGFEDEFDEGEFE